MNWSSNLYHGDCRDVMRTMEPNSVDSIVTDPPYGLSFMGKGWDHGVPGIEFWVEALRVSKPGAHLLAFGGTRTFHRLTVAIEDAGWDIRDCVMWVYGSGFPKSHNLKDKWSGWGTALKPAWEPIIMARKPLDGTVAQNVLKYGTGAININGARVGMEVIPAQVRGVSKIGTFEGADGNVTPEHTGRWPANLIHDGSDEVLGLFPNTKSGTGAIRKVAQGLFRLGGDGKANIEYGDSGSAARFFYCAKASKADRDEGLEGFELKQTIGGGGTNDPNGNDVCGKYQSVKSPARNYHPTVKPTELMRYLCKLVTQSGGVVMDPFMGSGSTGKAATLEGFNFIGIEQDAEYIKIAEARINNRSQYELEEHAN